MYFAGDADACVLFIVNLLDVRFRLVQSGSGSGGSAPAPAAAGATKEQLQAAFKVFDINGDGYITRDEFVAILTRPTRMMPHSEQQAKAIFAGADFSSAGIELLGWLNVF